MAAPLSLHPTEACFGEGHLEAPGHCSSAGGYWEPLALCLKEQWSQTYRKLSVGTVPTAEGKREGFKEILPGYSYFHMAF